MQHWWSSGRKKTFQKKEQINELGEMFICPGKPDRVDGMKGGLDFLFRASCFNLGQLWRVTQAPELPIRPTEALVYTASMFHFFCLNFFSLHFLAASIELHNISPEHISLPRSSVPGNRAPNWKNKKVIVAEGWLEEGSAVWDGYG